MDYIKYTTSWIIVALTGKGKVIDTTRARKPLMAQQTSKARPGSILHNEHRHGMAASGQGESLRR
jgi:hypothetical protein